MNTTRIIYLPRSINDYGKILAELETKLKFLDIACINHNLNSIELRLSKDEIEIAMSLLKELDRLIEKGEVKLL